MNISEQLINSWLYQRQEILTTLNNLARLLPSTCNNRISLTDLFQLLIDYTCAGHFKIFLIYLERIDKNFFPARKILEQINQSTDYIIKVNDKYNKFNNISVKDIVVLLEQFANRIELEDLLLSINHIDKHQIN